MNHGQRAKRSRIREMAAVTAAVIYFIAPKIKQTKNGNAEFFRSLEL